MAICRSRPPLVYSVGDPALSRLPHSFVPSVKTDFPKASLVYRFTTWPMREDDYIRTDLADNYPGSV